jgi:RsiW-degrading membrane proteinase PrsW (M82 family)
MDGTGVLAGWLLSALAAASVVLGTWLAYPRGSEPGFGRPALVFVGTAAALPVVLPLLAPLWLAGAGLPPVPRAVWDAFLGAALPEELFKLGAVWLLAFRGRPPRRVQDGAFYGVVAGMAFALVENVGYLLGADRFEMDTEAIAFLRTSMAGPGHAAYAAIAAHHLALARVAPPARRAGLVLRGLALAVAFHGTYDAVLLLAEPLDAGWLFYVAVVVFMGAVVTAFVGLERARRLDARRLARRGTAPLGR